MNTVRKLSNKELPMEFSIMPRSSVTLENLTDRAIAVQLTLFPEDSLANLSRLQEERKESTTQEICGPKPFESLSRSSQKKHFWKTYQDSSIQATSELSLTTYPKQGMIVNGSLCRLENVERPIRERDCGYLPTPDANNGKRGPGKVYNAKSKRQSDRTLNTFVRTFPTPSARDWKDNNSPSEAKRHTPPLAVHAGGSLNPMWVEWLMGWPIQSTSLDAMKVEEYNAWYGINKELQKLWWTNDPSEMEEWEAGLNLSQKNVLFSRMLLGIQTISTSNEQTVGEAKSAEDIRSKDMFDMQGEFEGSKTSCQQRPNGQSTKQYPDTLSGVSCKDREFKRNLGERESSRGEVCNMPKLISAEEEQKKQDLQPEMLCNNGRDFRQEALVSRITNHSKDRKHRLTALGNGQVPIVAFNAYRILSEI